MIKNIIKINTIILSILFVISVSFINEILALIPILKFEAFRGYLIVFEISSSGIHFAFHHLGFYIKLVITISILYLIFKNFVTGFWSFLFVFVSICIINGIIILVSDGALYIPFITDIQKALGPVMVILGLIYSHGFNSESGDDEQEQRVAVIHIFVKKSGN